MRSHLSLVGLAAALAVAGSASASLSTAEYAGDRGIKHMGAFHAFVTYSYTAGKTAVVTIELTNTTNDAFDGYITGIGVSAAGGAVISSLSETDWGSFSGLRGPFTAAPYGKFESGASVFTSWNGKNAGASAGIGIGSTATFSFLMTGNANKLASLNAETMFTNNGGGLAVRFRGMDGNNSGDKTVAYVLPGPGGLAVLALGAAGGRRRRR